MKKFLLILVIVVMSVVGIMLGFDIVLANINYSQNMKVWGEIETPQIIYYQQDYKNIKFGLGDIANNGCGACSVYNILYLDNKYVPLPDIVKKLDVFGETGFGLLGAKPFSIINILKQYGYSVNYSFRTNDFNDLAKNSRYSIYLYVGKTKGGMAGHYQLLTDYDEQKDNYQLYSPYYRNSMQNLLDYSQECFIKVLITVN